MPSKLARYSVTLFCFALLVGTVLHYWYVMQTHIINAGQGDDFVDILWFFEIFLSRENWQEKIDALFLANHEHITLLNHLLYWLHYRVLGSVNYLHYNVIGHLFVLASCGVLARWLAEKTGWLIATTIAVSCYLNLFFWQSSFWPMTAISNQAVILFALLAAWSYQKNPKNILAPIGWSLAATASQFNGLCVLLALLLTIVFDGWQNGKTIDRRQCWIVLLTLLLTSAAYAWRENPLAVPNHLDRFVMYTEPQLLPVYHNVNADLPPMAELARHFLMRVPASVIGTFGATVWPETRLLPALMTGAFLLGLFYYGYRRNGTIDRFSTLVFIFCLASLLLIALGRSLFFGAEACLLSRYRMYGFLMILLVGNGFLQGRSRQTAIVLLLIAGVVTQLASRQVLPAIQKNRDDVADTYYNWLVDGGLGREKMVFYPHNRDVRLLHAYERGYYNPMDAIDARYKPDAVTKESVSQCPAPIHVSASPSIKLWSKKPSAIAAEVTLTAINVPADKRSVLWFCNDREAYRVALSATQYNPAVDNFWPQLILKKQLPPAQYESYVEAAGQWQPLGAVNFR